MQPRIGVKRALGASAGDRKYGAPLPDDLTVAVARIAGAKAKGKRTGATGTVDTSLVSNVMQKDYLSSVGIGTPEQQTTLALDTGSSDFWVICGTTGAKNEYSPKSSSSSKPLPSGYSWQHTYRDVGDGYTVSGDVYTDVVQLGGMKVQNQAVQCAWEGGTENPYKFGAVGLAFGSLNSVSPQKQQTLFETMTATASPYLDLPVFTADLRDGSNGKYDFGFIDKSLYTGSLVYVPVDNSQGYWSFTAAGYGVQSAGLLYSQNVEIVGIADTGSPLMLLPDNVVEYYYQQLSGSSYSSYYGGWVFPCTASPPDFIITLEGDNSIRVPGSYINYVTLTNNVDFTNLCYGAVQSNSGLEFAVWGTVALKAAFVVFDGGNPLQLGFAKKINL